MKNGTRTRTKAARAIVRKKTLRQENHSSSTPPTTGPAANPRPDTAAQALTAAVRSRGSAKRFATMARLLGSTIAPPIPMTAWPRITTPVSAANATSRLPSPSTKTPVANTWRRPITSPTVAAVNTRHDTANE
jgi:hypothetical protein